MPRIHDLDWDQHCALSSSALIDAKRTIEKAESQRVGWEPDWKLRVTMLREQREEAFSQACSAAQSERFNRPGEREAMSRRMRGAWARGAFADRKPGYAKRTDELVATAKKMRAASATYQDIATALNVTAYTVAKWLGWQRKFSPTNRSPVMFEGVQYASLREAERKTGVSRHRIKTTVSKGLAQ